MPLTNPGAKNAYAISGTLTTQREQTDSRYVDNTQNYTVDIGLYFLATWIIHKNKLLI